MQKTLTLDSKIQIQLLDYERKYSDRVFSGAIIEEKTRNILNLNKDTYYRKYSPDILDFNHNIIGEIKSCNGNNKIFLFIEQFFKYKKLKDILNNHTLTLNGKKYENKFEFNYYFSKYEKEEIIYILKINEENLDKIFRIFIIKNKIGWNFNKKYIEITIKKLLKYGVKIYEKN